MPYTYLALAVFAFIAIFVPFSMVFVSRFLGPKTKQNPIKLNNHESAEVPVGTHRDMANEYLHYFPLYLGFELTAVMILGWAATIDKTQTALNFYMIGLAVVAFVLSLLALAIAKSKDWYG